MERKGIASPRNWRPALGLAAGMAAATLLAPSGGAADEWQTKLNEVMLRDHDCEVAFLSQVAEREVNGDLVILAKVHCVDKRTFDVYRESAFKPFEIHPCENPDNRVC